MADEIDVANEKAEAYRAEVAAVKKRTPAITTSENCLTCGAKTKNGRRWCDTVCRDAYDKDGQ